ncbi:MAG: PAS domain-containing protein [Nitriliruptorales bacterium]|nr:PAS domain-containing protein [Nitriliruptorales bacterium]
MEAPIDRAELRRYLRDLSERSDRVMITIHDPDGSYRRLSPAAEGLFGLTSEELVGRNPYEFFHPDDIDRIRTSHATVTATNQVSVVDYRLRHAEGHHTWVRSVAWGEFGDDSGRIVVLTVPRDQISELEVEQLESVPADVAQEFARELATTATDENP